MSCRGNTTKKKSASVLIVKITEELNSVLEKT